MPGNNTRTDITTEQSALVYDLLSEGPIEGLVDGVASIRLDGNPVANSTNKQKLSPQRSVDSAYTSSTGVLIDNTSVNIFSAADTDLGKYELLVVGAKKRATSGISATKGTRLITSTSNSFFANTDVYDNSTRLEPLIRIDGAGENGGQLAAGIVEYVNNTTIRIDQTVSTDVSNTACYIDLVEEVASFDTANNKCTLNTTGLGVDTANAIAILSSPERNAEAPPFYNYNNFGFAFRTGQREQTAMSSLIGLGSAAIAHAVSNGGLETTANTGYPSPSALDMDAPTDANGSVITSYSGNELVLTSSDMSIGNPSEIDKLKITLNFGQGLVSQKANGTRGQGFAEYRVTFGYSRDGGDSFTDAVIFGRNTIDTSTLNYYPNGCSKSSRAGQIRANTRTPFNYTIEKDISQFQPYDAYRLKIERISVINQKENDWTQTNQATVKSVENIVTDKFTYPYSAYAAVVVDAEDFQKIPKRSYEIYGLKVKVPTNYFPKDTLFDGVRRSSAAYTRNVTTGADAGAYQDWDGNFRGDQKTFTDPTDPNYSPVYTSNPVWIFLDLLTNPRYGAGQYLNEDFDLSQVDKYSLFQLAKYCDELVPDGKGGTEPRFECNLYLQKEDSVLKVLQNVAGMMRAMLIWFNGQISLGANIQKGAVYTFTKSNIIDGTVNYTGSSNRFRHNQIAITWQDPENQYKSRVEVVEDNDNIAKTGKIRRKKITAYGTTSRGQAIRMGEYQLYAERFETDLVNFRTGPNALALKPGDVINLQDPDLNDVIASGRVTTTANSTTTAIKTDRDLTSFINANDNFKLHLIYPEGGAYLSQPRATINSTDYFQGDLILLDEDGNSVDTAAKASNIRDDSGAIVQTVWSENVRVETQTVDFANSSSSTITVDSAFSSAPSSEVIYTLTGVDDDGVDVTGSLKQYMITSVKHDPKTMEVTINAVEYDINKFDTIDRGSVVQEEPDIQKRQQSTSDVPVPTNLSAKMVTGDKGSSAGQKETYDPGTGYSGIISWQHPITQRVNDSGDTIDDVYEDLVGYDVQHNFDTGDYDTLFKTERIRATNRNEILIKNITPKDNVIVRIRTVSSTGQTSGWKQREFDFPAETFTPGGTATVGGGLNQALMRGGTLSTTVDINSSTGLVTLGSSTYTFTPPSDAATIQVTSGNTNFTQEDFSGLANGETGFLLFDYDGNLTRGTTRVDPLKAIQLIEDTTAEDPSSMAAGEESAKMLYSFFGRVGEADSDLIAVTGTVATNANGVHISGTSTTFEDDFVAGDVIAINTGATRYMSTVSKVVSNTSMFVADGIGRAYSGATAFKQELPYNKLQDSIIGEVTKTAGVYSYKPFTNKQKVTDEDELGANVVNTAQIAANSIDTVQIAANAITGVQIEANSITSAMLTANAVDSFTVGANSITDVEIAANSIGTAEILSDAITNAHIAAGQITNAAIAAGAINNAQISANAINAVQIRANSVGSAEVALNSIDTVQIASDAITEAQVAAGAINTAQIAANAITTVEVESNAITSVQIAANQVSGIIIASGAIDDAAKLASGIVSGVKLANNAIDNARLVAANVIDNSMIAANQITAVMIAADQINGSHISADTIDAAMIIAGEVGNPEIAADSINAAQIKVNAVTTAKIEANAITSAKIGAGEVDTAEIAADAITNAKIAAGQITSAAIKADAINNTHIAAGQITNAMIASGQINNAQISAVATGKLTGTINNAQIAANAINAVQIKANSVNSAEIVSDAITNVHIAAGQITNAMIKAGAINNAQIGSVGTDKLTGTINNAQIAASAINNAQISAVATDKLTGTINNAQIAANAVQSAQISANSIESAEISSTDSLTLTVAGGTAGGWTINSTSLSATGIVIDSTNRRILISD